MSRANTPNDNDVTERFIRTFKEHVVNGKSFEEEVYSQMLVNMNFKEYRKIFNLYINSLNFRPNKKSKINHQIVMTRTPA